MGRRKSFVFLLFQSFRQAILGTQRCFSKQFSGYLFARLRQSDFRYTTISWQCGFRSPAQTAKKSQQKITKMYFVAGFSWTDDFAVQPSPPHPPSSPDDQNDPQKKGHQHAYRCRILMKSRFAVQPPSPPSPSPSRSSRPAENLTFCPWEPRRWFIFSLFPGREKCFKTTFKKHSRPPSKIYFYVNRGCYLSGVAVIFWQLLD